MNGPRSKLRGIWQESTAGYGGEVETLKLLGAECTESDCLVMVATDRERWRCLARRGRTSWTTIELASRTGTAVAIVTYSLKICH